MDLRKKDEIEVDDVEDLRVFREIIEMMYDKDLMGWLIKAGANVTMMQLARRHTSFLRRQWRRPKRRVRAMTGDERKMRATMAVIREEREGDNKSLGNFLQSYSC